MRRAMLALLWVLSGLAQAEDETPPPRLATADVLAAAVEADWRSPDPADTVYLQLPGGRVVFELAPQFAPKHVANLKRLIRQRYFDGLAILRVQENYVVQWGDPNAAVEQKARSLGDAERQLPGEFFVADRNLPFVALEAEDAYADRVGFVAGFPAAQDTDGGRTWLAHCYGMVGVGRDYASDSGSGAELYVTIGHAPRHLDRNVTLIGRVLTGMEYLTTLPRGKGELGFYTSPDRHVVITSMRLASQIPPQERTRLSVIRTDRPIFRKLVAARTFRREAWFVDPVERLGLCNMPIAVRVSSPD